jgi:hypothetical protein
MQDMSESERVIVDNKLRRGNEWIEGLNSFPYKSDFHSLIFAGGEPSLHPDFFEITTKVGGYKIIKIVTNLSFDVRRLIRYAKENNATLTVQPSFQFESADFDVFLEKMKLLDKEGVLHGSIPVSIVDLPDRGEVRFFQEKFRQNGYNPVLYKFEGYYKGSFDYADIGGFGCLGKRYNVICYSSHICVKPNGDIVFCCTDDYNSDAATYGNICDKIYRPIPIRRACSEYGSCHISSASWIRVLSPHTGKEIWRGKNFPKKENLAKRIYSFARRSLS